MNKKISKILILILFTISTTSFNLSLAGLDESDEETLLIDEVNTLALSASSSITTEAPITNSRAYVIYDRTSNSVIFGKNELEERPMASTTKIMTALVVLENCNLEDSVTISSKAAGTGGSRLGLSTNDKVNVKTLLYGLMLRSGNDAAVALAEHCGETIEGFAILMNEKAKELNLNNTNFVTPHGLDADGHYTTALDLAVLSDYALNNETFNTIVGTKTTTIDINSSLRDINNTNELLGVLNGVYGIKTGFTNGANRCLVTACKRNDMDLICIVLRC